ncbi:MAG TPA: winged helix DNA-binding protein [Bacteroidia bacterium]
MTREELFKMITTIDDPRKDFSKILVNLHYTHYYLMDRYKKVLEGYGLTVIQSNVLGIIVHYYPKALSLEEIKSMVLEPNSDVSRTVVRLETKGFVQKIPDPKNGRKLSISATAKGVKALRKMEADSEFQNFASEISVAEVKAFVKFLSKLRME